MMMAEMASLRCDDETNTKCLMPQVGSPPGFGTNYGTGFYTVKDYQDILQYAKDRHIQVIIYNNFDIPVKVGSNYI